MRGRAHVFGASLLTLVAACITVGQQGPVEADPAADATTDASADIAAGNDVGPPTADAGVDAAPCSPKIAGPKFAQSANEEVSGDRGWGKLSQAVGAFDELTATSTLLRTQRSHTLVLGNFGFGVPINAKITGVEFVVRRKSGETRPTQTIDIVARPFPRLGGSESLSPTNWGPTFESVTYGGPNQTFGVNLSAEQVNGPSFTFALAAQFVSSDASDNTIHVDGASARVFYCE